MRKTTLLTLVACGMFALALVGCQPHSPQSAPPSSPDAKSATSAEEAAFQWTADANCGQCHADSEQSYTDSACTASLHSTVPCTTCHSDEEGLGKAHEKVTLSDTDGADKLKKTAVNTEACLSCHALDEGHIAATADSTALTDKLGNTINPHDLPVFEDTGRGTHEKVTCSSCHKMHSTEGAAEEAPGACKSCHHQGTYVSCYSAGCHESA